MCAGRGVITPVAVQPSEAWFILKRGSQRRRAQHKNDKNGCCSEDGGRLPEACPTVFDGTQLLGPGSNKYFVNMFGMDVASFQSKMWCEKIN